MSKGKYGIVFICLVGFIILVADSGTAISGMRKGIEQCLYTVIPSLFPFSVLSVILTSSLLGWSVPILKPICRLCGIPEGCESLFLVGFLGGYPVGAQLASGLYEKGCVAKVDAERMAVLCNNAGPAFLFGLLGPLFPKKAMIWVLWLILILSAIIMGILLPKAGGKTRAIPETRKTTVPDAIHSAAGSMIRICSCIVLFRMVLDLLDRHLMGSLPGLPTILISGLLELTNGCIQLTQIENLSCRFMAASVFLSFGGICVWMQTVSVCRKLNMKRYLPIKLLQACISLTLSLFILPFIAL